MNYSFVQTALRELREHLANPVRILAFTGIAIILVIIEPFGTGNLLPALPSFLYWLVIISLSYSIGFLAHELARNVSPEKMIKRFMIAGSITAAGGLIVVHLVNGLTFGFWPAGSTFLKISINVVLISFIISGILQYAYATQMDKVGDARPAIIGRLPVEKRGQLVSLSVEDHYVRIRTIKGEEMILMRLGDAVREVGNTIGLQTHRSHWVAIDQVKAVSKKGDGAVLTMSHGPDIPVSRSNMKKIRQAGLF